MEATSTTEQITGTFYNYKGSKKGGLKQSFIKAIYSCQLFKKNLTSVQSYTQKEIHCVQWGFLQGKYE